MIRLLCVEDDALVRSYLATRLALETDIEVVAEVGTAGEALALLQTERIDVILLDYQLDGPDGFQLLGALIKNGTAPAPRILFCTGLCDDRFESEARSLGAHGVVPKQRMSVDLVPAIRAVARGDAWYRPT